MSKILAKLENKLEKLAESNLEDYDPNCAYEVEMYNYLEAAGINANPPPPSASEDPRFCTATDAGADASFYATGLDNSREVVSLELKRGSGMKMGAAAGLSSNGRDIVDIVRSKNTVPNIAQLLRLDLLQLNQGLASGIMPKKPKGLSLKLPPGVTSVDIGDDVINSMADAIVLSHEADIDALVASGKSALRLYYYFGRTGQARGLAKDHGVNVDDILPTVLSMKDTALAGSLVSNYNKSNVFYIQIQGSGMFYLGADPLTLEEKLGVKNYSGNVKSVGTGAFNAAGGGGGTTLLSTLGGAWPTVSATLTFDDGRTETVDIPVQARHRNFAWKEGEKLTGGGARSGFDLNSVAAAQQLADAVSTPPIVSESTKKKSRALIRELLGLEKNAISNSSLLRLLLLQEGNRGDVYEQTLIDGVNDSGVEGVQMAKNDFTAWDLNATLTTSGGDKIKGKIEVKLGPDDQLGKIWKESFSKLEFHPSTETWVGEMKPIGATFSVNKGEGKTITQADIDLGEHLISVLNGNKRTTAEMMKIVNNDPANFPDLSQPIDLKSGLSARLQGKKPGGGAGYSITGGVRDAEYRTLRQAQAARRRAGEPAMTEEEEAEFAEIELLIPAEDVTHIFDAKVNYLIVGGGKGSEGTPAGRIGLVGSDVLRTGVAPINFGDSRIEIRWGNKGSKENPKYSFVIETRAAGLAIEGGQAFSSGADLANILTANDQSVDTSARRSRIGGQNLGLPSAYDRRQAKLKAANENTTKKGVRLRDFHGKRMTANLLKGLLNKQD